MDEIYVGMRATVSLYNLFMEKYEADKVDGDKAFLERCSIIWSGGSSEPQPGDYYDLYDVDGFRHLFGMDGETVEVTAYDGEWVEMVFEDDQLQAPIEMTEDEFRTATEFF